jgi:predicted MPP superfamily phosphohydrolase
MPVPTADVALVRGPYLQSVTTDTIIVVWETDTPSHGEVVYGKTEPYARVVDPAVGARHAVTLASLAPYTVYHYRVESDGAPLSEDAAFRTAAGPDQAGFTFVVFGDTRMQHQIHRAVVARILALAPDFVLHTGDLVTYGYSASEWEIFFEIERELMARVPLFPVPGNHEGNTPHYLDLFYLPGNERWYTFDYGNARFVCLQVDGVADFAPGSEQYAWLEETLATNTQPWLFVTFHVPPYSSLREDAEEIAVREVLAPLFEQHGVDVVFNGHHHNYQRSTVNGVTYIVTGGGGAPIYEIVRADDHLLAYRNAYHVLHVTVAGDTLTGVGVTPEGEPFDRFTLTSGGRD